MKYGKRWVAIGVTVAVGVMGLEYLAPINASATQVDLACEGKVGDKASSLNPGDSKSTLALLATLGGGGAGLSFPVEVTPNAPEKVTPSSGPFNADFDFALTLPDSIVKQAKETLKLSSITVNDASFAVEVSGAATATLVKTVPTLTVDLNKSPVVINQRISGSITPKGSGRISYKPGNTTLSIALNTKVTTVELFSLTVTCSSNKEISATRVQIPGAPTVAPIIYVGGRTNSWSSKQLLPGEITPDSGNPITPGSLRVVAQAPNGGFATVGPAGDTAFLAPADPGLYNVTHEVCAASKVVPAVPGISAVQSLTFPESKRGPFPNPHPLSMALQFKGAKSKTIPLSYVQDIFGNSAAYPSGSEAADNLLGEFRAPTAATIQAALEGIPTIGKGNVTVTGGGGTAPYQISFVGALGLAEQPKIEVVDWNTWLPANGLTVLLATLNPPPPPITDPPTPTTLPKPVPTLTDLDNKLALQQITLDEYLAGRGEIFKAEILAGASSPDNIKAVTALFPKQPEVKVVVDGKALIPEGATGPLCSTFDVAYFVLAQPTSVLPSTITRSCSTKKVRVKVKGKYKYVSKRLCSTTTCVTKPVKVRVRVTVNGKKKYVSKTVNKRVCTKKKA